MARSFYKGISAVFLTFSLDKEDTLEGLRGWQREVRDNGHPEIVFFLVGAKSDIGLADLA